MHENTHQQSKKPNNLESNEKMKGLMPPAFGFTDGESEGNVVPNVKYSSEISYEDGTPAGDKGKTTPSVVVNSLLINESGGGYNLDTELICWPLVTLWAGDKALGTLLNIEDENSPHITASNFEKIALALHPDENGYTHTLEYWSKPITRFHEEIHAQEMIDYGRENLQRIVIDPLKSKQLRSESDVEFEVYDLANDLTVELMHLMRPEAEKNAYLGTRHKFLALSKAILEKGRAGGYK
jgi:hypothetical protein